ncbi:Alb1-domain-containing protein [Xylariales sp. PMI_506]|nr:Alb1-domain-containing protein [Xylariales sp. PMI_506]
MAKGTISKKKALSKHSREARRATSPGIDLDKSLKNVKPPSEKSDHRPSVLAIHQGAGVTKKSKRGRNQSFKAKRRAEKNQDKAFSIMERTENKIAKSKTSSRNVQTRRKTWDEINKSIPQDKKLGDHDEDGEEEEEEVSELDDEMDEAENVTTTAVAVPSAMNQDHDVDDDGIL